MDDYDARAPGLPRRQPRQLTQLPLAPEARDRAGASLTASESAAVRGVQGADAAQRCIDRRAGRRVRTPGGWRAGDARHPPTRKLTQQAIDRLQVTAAHRRPYETWQALAIARRSAIALALAILFAVLIAPGPIRAAGPGHPPDGLGRLHACGRGERAAGPALSRPAPRMAAHAPQGPRGPAEPLPAPCVARTEDATHRGARRLLELLRDEVGGPSSTWSSTTSMRIVRENTISLQKLIEDLLKYHQTRALEPGPRSVPCCWATSSRACCATTSSLRWRVRMITFSA